MTSEKHTPGPWKLEYSERQAWSPEPYPRAVVDANGKPIVVSCITMTTSRFGEPLANARLIASAPDLLEALDALGEAIAEADELDDPSIFAAMAKAAAALRKAEGK